MNVRGRVSITSTDSSSNLLIAHSLRSDSGVYKVSAKNEAGHISRSTKVNILGRIHADICRKIISSFCSHFSKHFCFATGKPSPPQKPLEYTAVAANEITLSWQPPADDGGGRITSYTVERCEAERDHWHSVADVRDLSVCCTGLKKGQSYKFRVKYVIFYHKVC